MYDGVNRALPFLLPVPNWRGTQRHPWKVTDQPQQQQQPPRGKYTQHPQRGNVNFKSHI
ncbi:hypothetical protein GHT06_009353 [Daphnia sinensis]|uniref:Uncharacterized protein n=1 Tax=Daphnia sinensis TaxID=1820382 RepID=A0AAD5PZ66_9CRUS|nr:hypothetical protein GHT06_009353 [Daphnia sinensis]